MASQQRRLRSGSSFHSDRGSQYTAQAFPDQCAVRGITQSMGETGVCWDKAVAEAFFATLKADLIMEVGTFASQRAAKPWVIPYGGTTGDDHTVGTPGGPPSSPGVRHSLHGQLSQFLDTHQCLYGCGSGAMRAPPAPVTPRRCRTSRGGRRFPRRRRTPLPLGTGLGNHPLSSRVQVYNAPCVVDRTLR